MLGDYRKIENGSTEPNDHDEYDGAVHNVLLRSRSERIFGVLKFALIAFLSLWGFINISLNVFNQVSILFGPDRRGCYCGTTSTEAIALGCKYDSLAAAWLPDHCRDDELTAEFDRSGDGPNGTWLYFKDTHHTIPISVEEIQWLGDTPDERFHMDYSWHEVHCLFYWRKEHRFRLNGKTLDPRSDTEEHIKHCGMVWARKATYGISVYLDVDSFYRPSEIADHLT
ncbi:hypothetical protein BJ166DRAFT_529259 [Pestalotiopsis sp. NC0098]|nr:hypothetical protein BJ166DRAFT_529259 [Pestalotiopsis sp. NC0098]